MTHQTSLRYTHNASSKCHFFACFYHFWPKVAKSRPKTIQKLAKTYPKTMQMLSKSYPKAGQKLAKSQPKVTKSQPKKSKKLSKKIQIGCKRGAVGPPWGAVGPKGFLILIRAITNSFFEIARFQKILRFQHTKPQNFSNFCGFKK